MRAKLKVTMDFTKNLDAFANKIDVQKLLGNIDYRVARTKNELECAYALVYKEYLKRNYTTHNKAGLRLSIHNAHPDTVTFIGVIEDQVLATATLITDSPLGLPMDKIYGNELAQLRKTNDKICEISMLASDTELFKGGTSLMLNAKKLFFIFYLFKIIFDYAKDYLRLDCICITINPRHKLTYDFLLFKDIGNLKIYEHANDAPAIAKYLDLNTVEAECKRTEREGLYKMFFIKKTAPQNLSKKFAFSPQDLKYFFVEKTDILKKATPDEIEYLKSCYPDYDFSEIIP